MKLIGAGFPRTGTMSTKVALEYLGFGPCYHFVTQFERPRDIDAWEMLAQGKTIDWRALFADFHSAVDWPASIFYRQLMDVYPDAKVLLNMRDPDAWYESMMQTVYYAVHNEEAAAPRNLILDRLSRTITTLAWQNLFHGRFEDRSYALAVFEQHNQEVKEIVPADRLLVWRVQEGWEPLCRFLGVEVPTIPFPRLNDIQEFRQQFTQRSPQGS